MDNRHTTTERVLINEDGSLVCEITYVYVDGVLTRSDTRAHGRVHTRWHYASRCDPDPREQILRLQKKPSPLQSSAES